MSISHQANIFFSPTNFVSLKANGHKIQSSHFAKMFFIILIKTFKKKVIVPSKWVKGLNVDLIKLFNYGKIYNKHKTYTVFISNNHDDEPNFEMGISAVFDTNLPACYEATLSWAFGKKINFH